MQDCTLFHTGVYESADGVIIDSKVYLKREEGKLYLPDALLLEGTSFGRDDNDFITESDVEDEMIKISNDTEGLVLVQQSSQNIDRLVSFYRAAIQSDRLFVIDFYTANILSVLKDYANTPYPSKKFPDIKVFYPFYLSKRMVNQGNEDLLYKFKYYKITKEEIADKTSKVMMLVRSSMVSDMKIINSFNDSSFVYSLWDGYLQEDSMNEMLEFIKQNNIKFHKVHTSGHASLKTLNKVVNRLKPEIVIPIHTFCPDKYFV
ncbi:MAG: MBL fold metallo-hydrolase RNA specificity domain-containing protein [Nanoarchaeota archaeon]